MPEMTYKEFDVEVASSDPAAGGKVFAPVYLIFGEELLVKRAHESLVAALLPGNRRQLSYELVSGDNDHLPELLTRMNTYSLLSGTKVVSCQDSRVFDSQQNREKLLEKAKTAWENDEPSKAASYLLGTMAQAGLLLEDLQSDERGLSQLLDGDTDGEWLPPLLTYCRENGLRVPANRDYSKLLQDALKKGFPKKNHLIITTDTVDRRRELYQSLKEYGVVVDCSVPKGNRQADQKIQEEVIRERMRGILAAARKKIDPRAFEVLYEMTGFNLRTFSGNLEKLVLFVGDREMITAADVEETLDRTREDPIFELTGAVSDRNVDKALFYLGTLLSKDTHPLQVLAALANHFRKILVAKAFTESPHGRVWKADMPYNRFSTAVLPALKAYDTELLETTAAWDTLPSDSGAANAPGEKKKKKRKKKNLAEELIIVQNPGNPYPLYLLLKKTDRFTLAELLESYALLGDLDIRLKSAGHSPRILLETLIVRICKGRG